MAEPSFRINELVDACYISKEVFDSIIFHIEEYPDRDDEEIAFDVLEEEGM